MKACNKFLKEIRQINIEAVEYVFFEGVGWEKNIDFEDLPKTLKKRSFWELENLNEEKLKKLQSDAINELSLLSDDQLKRYLKRLDLINEFQIFFDFIKSFYVKFEDNKHNSLDVFDFKKKLEEFFYTKLPNTGEFEIYFLEGLQDQLFFKSSILDGLKWQIEYLLGFETEPLTPQQPEATDLNNTSTTKKDKVFDPNHFNEDCHNLFNYLVDNYTKKGKIKFINIYYFLKDEVDKQKYSFNFIQDDYTLFIKVNHQIEIKKYQKAVYDFEEQKRILNSHEELFRKQ